MHESLHQFYLHQTEPNKSCLIALRQIILQHDPAIAETQKYGMPCFCLRSKPLCYLWTDKKSHEPYILFVDGILISHSALEQGNRSRMKILRVNPVKNIPINIIQVVLAKAMILASR